MDDKKIIEDKQISEFVIGEVSQGFFLIRSVESRTASNNNKYLDFTLADKTGEINAKLWHCTEKDEAKYIANKLVKVRGNVTQWQGRLQYIIEKVRLTTEDDNLKVENFVPSAPYPAEEMYSEVLKYVGLIKNSEINMLVNILLEENKDRLIYYPAAQKNHHSYRSGLLYHITSMLKVGEGLSKVYEFINLDLLYAGIILHDIAKLFEMDSSELGIVSDYTMEGNLLGHIVQGIKMIERVASEIEMNEETAILLQHMILSHHNEPEFGSPKRPMIPEAELLHHIDTIDARMFDMKKNLDNINEGDFSDRVWLLHNRKIYKPKV
ncbi:3'-5' exoribonuclease [Desulfonispora thiosulfatigenes DSM 11270]|uniref:3'-5' exoribonuclease n=1 Tax=Desulfonispora thiosulfatigenes DSM 11270 TaxID=656914 RepID=A0A1W1UKJ6_DESTI|nr:HD domain-containing protein [Desulfonispora thiosulfatigenes]SMB81543.1 3'-5' exoribonuclease [Desulfonispora thiosulfatigenes DSM 11270]